jgi:hypothetical protein
MLFTGWEAWSVDFRKNEAASHSILIHGDAAKDTHEVLAQLKGTSRARFSFLYLYYRCCYLLFYTPPNFSSSSHLTPYTLLQSLMLSYVLLVAGQEEMLRRMTSLPLSTRCTASIFCRLSPPHTSPQRLSRRFVEILYNLYFPSFFCKQSLLIGV